MSTVKSKPEQTSPAASSSGAPAKRQRVLACVQCQQRKIKCDRKFPCVNCVKASTHCVPAGLVPRQRRRRFAERELLDRLRQYEGLLRENGINFEPLHTLPAAEKAPPITSDRGTVPSPRERSQDLVSDTDQLSKERSGAKSETVYEPKDFWDAMNLSSRDPEDEDLDSNDGDDNSNDSESQHNSVREEVLKKTWDQLYERNDLLLFGSRNTNIALSTLHPQQVHIFRLWQIYLENINPMLMVTHTPTLQTRIIDAAGNLANISPTLEALLFSIYCIALLSITPDECRNLFGAPKEDLLMTYRFGCQQSLLNCGLLRSADRECLTALYLYLISVRPESDPRSLSSLLGIAIRIAQRMGIDNESKNTKCTGLEAEMRRRIWWSLIVFDNRIGEMSDLRSTMLTPNWDCRTLLNINDSDIRPEMKAPPTVHEKPTEALFAVLRSEMADFVRHSAFHLDFSNPALKSLAKNTRNGPIPEGNELMAFERTMEDRYLKFCDPENPLHFMTMWTVRIFIAKARLLEHYSKQSRSSLQQNDLQRDAAISHALNWLECDAKIMLSPLTKGFLWQVHFYFPFPAYIHLVQDLEKRPLQERTVEIWNTMSHNYEAHLDHRDRNDGAIVKLFLRIILQAWEACEAAFRQIDKPLEPTPMVTEIKHRVAQISLDAQNSNVGQPDETSSMKFDGFSFATSMDFGSPGLPFDMGEQSSADSTPWSYPSMHGHTTMDVDGNQLDWTTIDRIPMRSQGTGNIY